MDAKRKGLRSVTECRAEAGAEICLTKLKGKDRKAVVDLLGQPHQTHEQEEYLYYLARYFPWTLTPPNSRPWKALSTRSVKCHAFMFAMLFLLGLQSFHRMTDPLIFRDFESQIHLPKRGSDDALFVHSFKPLTNYLSSLKISCYGLCVRLHQVLLTAKYDAAWILKVLGDQRRALDSRPKHLRRAYVSWRTVNSQ